MRAARHQNPWGRTKLTTFAAPHRLVIPSLAFCLTLLPGHGIKRSRFLLNVLAAALGAFRVHFVFFQGENYFEGFVTIFANVVVHGHGGLPLDCDHELRLELYRQHPPLVCEPEVAPTSRLGPARPPRAADVESHPSKNEG